MNKKPCNPDKEGGTTGLSGKMTYGKYLDIDSILKQQRRLSSDHDEMLFII